MVIESLIFKTYEDVLPIRVITELEDRIFLSETEFQKALEEELRIKYPKGVFIAYWVK